MSIDPMLIMAIPAIGGSVGTILLGIRNSANQKRIAELQAQMQARTTSGTVETSTAGEVQNWEKEIRTWLTLELKEARREIAELKRNVDELRKRDNVA